jgi:hypothetical protein
MPSSQHPTPIILCGKSEHVGAGVIEGLKPEYEVVQFISNTEACVSETPTVLQGQAPSNPSSTLGTGNVSRRPVAVVLGGGYTATFDEIRDGVEAAFPSSGGSGVAWLKHDGTIPAPPLGPEYSKAILKRTKDVLKGLVDDGTLVNGKSEVYLY